MTLERVSIKVRSVASSANQGMTIDQQATKSKEKSPDTSTENRRNEENTRLIAELKQACTLINLMVSRALDTQKTITSRAIKLFNRLEDNVFDCFEYAAIRVES
ncbi:hypothetical protein RCL_jg6255.t1 [Rhizophagus clarus]|uniref:Uncharacterized protein n=1 Tax=Rhizophagus clarus TaxID=94130 RepID=A0A8H3L0G7_9GLOM|nr:hypothetical protein RCL_jg6255.t1 [Rhizophagus clarus]